MDTRLKYQGIIKTVLQNHANYRATLPDGYTSQVIFDDERGHYLVLDFGWSGNKYLMEAGIPKEDIVLGFRYPKIRKYTGFAVA